MVRWGFAPAAVGRAESLVQHVDVEPIDAVGQLLGDDAFHRFEITGVQAEAANGLAVRAPHFPFGMRLQKMPRLLNHAVGDDRKLLFPGLVYRLA